MFPWIAVAIIGAIVLSRSITMLSLGEDVARGLGQRTALVKLAGTLLVLILAGAAVSVVGAVGFVGLIIPHLTRYIAPGLTSLLARRAYVLLERIDRTDISIMLGLADQHGKAAIEWTVDHLANGFTDGKRTDYGGTLGRRTEYRFPFADQYALQRTLGLPSDASGARNGEQVTVECFFHGNEEAQLTARVAAYAADALYRRSDLPPGVFHLDQLLDLDSVLEGIGAKGAVEIRMNGKRL